MEDKRIGVISVVIETPGAVQGRLNDLISAASSIVIGRMGIPYKAKDVAVLALLVDGTSNEINALTGRLGSLPGVAARAALTKP